MSAQAAVAFDWDAWRASYDEWGFAQQQEFYDLVYEAFPAQARFSTAALETLLDHVGTPVSVVELGGWDGEFAAELLPRRRQITSWTNYEISAAAATAAVCADPRFRAVALDDWYWSETHACDVFVSSHTIEHLRLADVLRAFDATVCRWMYLQAPLAEEPTDWRGYHGSHIIEVGWAGLTSELGLRGYRPLPALTRTHVRCFGRRP